MKLPDDECARFITDAWLNRVAHAPLDEVQAMVDELGIPDTPSVFVMLAGAIRQSRKNCETHMALEVKRVQLLDRKDAMIADLQRAVEVHVEERMKLATRRDELQQRIDGMCETCQERCNHGRKVGA